MGAEIFRAKASDAASLKHLDEEAHRLPKIQAWIKQGQLWVARSQRLLGYVVVSQSFFGRSFVELLYVARDDRGKGLGTELLGFAVAQATSPRVFTSTNLSNQKMQALLKRSGWTPCGMVSGLDEGDPEVFYYLDKP